MSTVPWYITFGYGGPWGGYYSEIRVPESLTRDEQRMAARMAAHREYGTVWAFDYAPEKFEQSIARYGMKLREVVRA